MPYESGIRALRLEFVRETVEGVTPDDPDWLLYSDAVQMFEVSPTASISPRGNIGTPDVVNFNAGTESHEFSLTYDMQRWPSASGDATYDGMVRDADGALPASHSMLARARTGHSGLAGTGSYIFYYAVGAKINTLTLGGEPESGDPITVTLNYICRKLRAYQVDQPTAASNLTVVSTSTNDTTQTLDLEDDTAATTESVSLNGTTPVVTTATFSSIGAAWLDAETEGDVTVTDGTNLCLTLYGSSSYNDREGDRGIPLLGSGSRGAAIATGYESILGDEITRGGNPLGIDADVSSVSLTVENNIETSSTIYSIGQILSEGPRTITLSASIFGPTASYDQMVDHLRAVESDIVWTLTGGTLTLSGAALTDLGSIARDTGLALLSIDNTFQGKSLAIAAA